LGNITLRVGLSNNPQNNQTHYIKLILSNLCALQYMHDSLQKVNYRIDFFLLWAEPCQLASSFGASTATSLRLFFTLKNVFSDHRQSMLHHGEANVIQFVVEKDFTNRRLKRLSL